MENKKGEFDVKENEIPKKKTRLNIENGEDKFLYMCPFCITGNQRKKGVTHKNYSFGNMQENLDELIKHMKTCFKNPRSIDFQHKCSIILDNEINCESKRKINDKFLMSKGYYHKSHSNPDAGYDDLCIVHEETDNAYIGSFVFGIGMFDVVFLKEQVRELTDDEIKGYEGKKIAINNNPPLTKLNIKENKYESLY